MLIRPTITGSTELRDKLRQVFDAPRRALARTAEDVEEFVGREVSRHSQSGAIFASIVKRREGDGWFVGHDGQRAPHAIFVHWPTKPHLIKPRKKKVLRWPAAGGFRFAKVVHHPGYKGDPWMVRAAAMAPLTFDRHVQALLAEDAAKGGRT